jgi:pimeloyl-ACP methyl ester carboxylesterase
MSDTRYARCGDLSIAWQVIGDGPVDLVVIPGLVSHVEAFHDLPGYTRLLARLGRFARVITFDKRGNGLSDRVADAPSLPERIDDVHAVLDAVGSRRAAIFGISEGGALAIRFAATEPARTSALALFGAFPRMLAAPGYECGFPPDAYEQFTGGMIDAWGTGTPLLTLFGPSLANADASVRDAAARCERLSATPTTLRALWRMNASIDVRDSLAKIAAPTLIMHRTDDRVVPVATGRWIAAQMPHARYVELPGHDHFPFSGDQDALVEAIAQLLDASPESRESDTRSAREGIADTSPAGPVTELSAGAFDRLVSGALGDQPFQLGRFLISRTLGSGGMGSVYLAEDRDLGRQVALKLMHRGDADAYRRFRREAMAVASLSHPNVVQMYELGLDASVPYLVMEYVRGGTASALEVVPPRRAVQIVRDVARGLGAAHAVGIVHRDVKPANILLDSERAKIADFGVAKLAGSDAMTRQGAIVGTVGYLAPEQARGDAVDARADVYALGATLFRLLTGTRPFTGTVPETIAATISSPIPDPRSRDAEIPERLAMLVCRMGALDPAHRLPDGAAVAEALAELT